MNEQIMSMKELLMKNMEHFGRQISQKFSLQVLQMEKNYTTLYEQNLKKKLAKINKQQEQISIQIQKISQQIIYLSKNYENNENQNSSQKSYHPKQIVEQIAMISNFDLIFETHNWQKNFLKKNNTITALQKQIKNVYEFKINVKIERMKRDIYLGIYDYERRYIFYNTCGQMFNQFKFEQSIPFPAAKNGSILSISRDMMAKIFIWKIKNPKTSKIESRTIKVTQFQQKNQWSIFIYFDKKGDSVTIYK